MIEQKKLSMSFDWRSKKNSMSQGPRPGFNFGMPIGMGHQTEVKGAGELVNSILLHIENLVKKSDDFKTWDECNHNPEMFAKKKVVDSIIMPYVMMHKLDSGSILYIAERLKNDSDNASFTMENGMLTEAKVEDNMIYISPQAILRAIVKNCM